MRFHLAGKAFHLAGLLRNERLSRDELIHRQNVKLRRLVDHAYRHVPFYRHRFDAIGLKAGDIRGIDDLPRLPVVDKSELLRHPEDERMDSRRAPWAELLPIRTSGSSGVTLEFRIEPAYDRFRKAQFLRPYVTNGLRPWDRMLTFTGHPDRRAKLHNRLGLFRDHRVHASAPLERQMEAMRRSRATVIRSYPSVLALLGASMMEGRQAPPALRLLFTDSELLTSAMRQTIETAFAKRPLDIYGTFETENIAYECPQHAGYHITMDCVIMEFLKGGRPVSPGETGEIVCTVLDNITTPFIRYNLHDLGTYTEKPCPCGRSFPLMTTVLGRQQNFAVLEGGAQVSSTGLIAEMGGLAGDLRAYQVVQLERGLFQITVLPARGLDGPLEKRLRSMMARLFPDTETRIEVGDHFERLPSGKFQPFISHVAGAPASTSDRHAG